MIELHKRDDYFTVNRSAVVAISAFLPGEGAAELQSVAPNGREWFVRDVFNWALQNSGQKQLTAVELEKLQKAVHDLPEQSNFPGIDPVTIVSFRDGAHWVTRYYDQRNPPQALRQIQTIIDGARRLSILELQDEAAAAAKKTVADSRAITLPGGLLPEIKLEDAVTQSIAIFTGTLTRLEGPRDAQLGEARYYGTALLSQILRGPVISQSVAFDTNYSTRQGMSVAIDARLMPTYDENQTNIFFVVKMDYEHPRTTVGSDYTVLKFLPATNANKTKVQNLLAPASTK